MQKYIGHCGASMINNTSFYFGNYFDWVIMKDHIIKKRDNPKHIYIKIDYLPKYLHEIIKCKEKFILITGCGDYSPQIQYSKEYSILINLSNMTKWYAENNLSFHPKMFSLTVGFATHSKEYENNLLEIRKHIILGKKKHKVFCCWRPRQTNCCGQEFVERGKMTQFIHNYSNIFDIQKETLNVIEFQKKLSTYKWCLCPLGNGVDCAPKIIECFFLKTIPIVKKNPNVLQLYNKYPVIWVDKFTDIIDMELIYDTTIDWDKIINEFTCDFWYKKIIT